jgi:hypothetical protein
MKAVTKFSITLPLVTATAIAVYLYATPGDEGFDPPRSEPPDAICKQDGERLARLRARPSLDEGLAFVGEIRCVQLWPQLQTLLDSLSDPSRSTASSKLDPPASDTTSGGDAASSPGATSAMLDDACKRDEDRLVELRANPSVDAAIRFDSELRCPRVQPQLPAILKQLGQGAGSVDLADRKAPAPDTMSASVAAPPASEPRAPEATSDACKHDEQRLAELQVKPSLDEAVRLENEMQCLRLQPQVLALLDKLIQAPQSAGALTPNGARRNTTSATPASEPPTSEAASATSVDACNRDEDRLAELQANPTVDKATRLANEFTCIKLVPQLLAILDSLRHAAGAAPPSGPTGAGTISAGEAASPTLEPPASEATSEASDDACKQDEQRMARLRTTPSGEELARFAQELRCETLRPALRALIAASASLPESASVSEDAGARRNQTNETLPTPQSAADAERRIAQLESEKGALAAEVSRLRQQASFNEQAHATPSPPPAAAVERSETPPASAAANAERRIAQLESEKGALIAEVRRLQHDREAPSADEVKSPPATPRAAHAKRSASDPFTALASLPTGMPARVLIRYLPNNADARAQAEMLASVFERQGIEVADLRESRSAIRPELSFSYAPDEAIAQQVGRLVGVAPVRRLQPKDGLMVRPGTVELNLSGDSHLAASKTTSTRESNHE